MVRSCLLVTLIKCPKGHKCVGSLCRLVKTLIVSSVRPTGQASKQGTRSPIELFWTAKNVAPTWFPHHSVHQSCSRELQFWPPCVLPTFGVFTFCIFASILCKLSQPLEFNTTWPLFPIQSDWSRFANTYWNLLLRKNTGSELEIIIKLQIEDKSIASLGNLKISPRLGRTDAWWEEFLELCPENLGSQSLI